VGPREPGSDATGVRGLHLQQPGRPKSTPSWQAGFTSRARSRSASARRSFRRYLATFRCRRNKSGRYARSWVRGSVRPARYPPESACDGPNRRSRARFRTVVSMRVPLLGFDRALAAPVFRCHRNPARYMAPAVPPAGSYAPLHGDGRPAGDWRRGSPGSVGVRASNSKASRRSRSSGASQARFRFRPIETCRRTAACSSLRMPSRA
jgi:hypothetical protein